MARVLKIAPTLPRLDALRATLGRYARELSPQELPAVIGELEAAKAVVWTRLR